MDQSVSIWLLCYNAIQAEVSGESSHLSRAHTEESHLSVASFDYRDLENSNLNRISSASSSGEEFEFPPQPPLPRGQHFWNSCMIILLPPLKLTINRICCGEG